MPTVPKFTKTQNKNGDSNDDTNQNQNSNPKQKQRTYAIQTNGCQMNVADSERLEGILQNELGLQPINMDESYRPVNKQELNTADVIIFNTCSIRDHAEQKLYDALGPFRARKRQKQVEGDTSNSDFALIVTGCVAQQEGLRLLQKIPEIDVVLGPQYVPYLSEVLTKIEWGYQFCLTEPTIIIDNYKTNYDGSSSTTKTKTPSSSIESSSIESSSESSTLTSTTATPSSSLILGQQLPENDDFSSKPIRGHAVRAWVNVIYGCNEHCTYCVVPASKYFDAFLLLMLLIILFFSHSLYFFFFFSFLHNTKTKQ
jgi:tRNA A37 methylthiotransferase MiaB